MRGRLLVTGSVPLLAALLWWGCLARPQVGVVPRGRPGPVVALASQSYAYRVVNLSSLPLGVGAEGRPGDFLLENAFVRFVVAAADRTAGGYVRGNVIDAAVQGGEDRMRLLVPMLRGSPPVRPVYTEVRIENAGGLDVPAVIVAEGHLPGSAQVKVRTAYTLKPGWPMLEISTTVENGTDSMLALFELGDALYHGRTLRFVPGAGLCPVGKRFTCRWLSFFWQDRAWGLIAGAGDNMTGTCGVGVTELRYTTGDIPPGTKRSYRRFLMAAVGGPEKVWLEADSGAAEALSLLDFVVKDAETRQPVQGATLAVAPVQRPSPLMLWTDSLGRAQLQAPPGWYEVTGQAPGRAPPGSVRVEFARETRHELGIYLPARSEALVTVRARTDDYVVPVSARVTARRLRAGALPAAPVPGFPLAQSSVVALTDGSQEARLALAPAGESLPRPYLLVASKGPLFHVAGGPVEAATGRTLPVAVTLGRAVDPGRYVAVDFRQHTDASLDCALTVPERALANACEGLDGAVVSDPVFRTVFRGLTADAECALVPGFRAELCGVGSFSFLPLEAQRPEDPDLSLSLRPGVPAAEVFKEIRQVLPGAIIQVDNPLDGQKGYFALSGFNPLMGRPDPPGFSDDFDALEILSGDRVAAAEKLLSYWFHLLNRGRKVIVTGGSGSRGIVGEVAGIARTFVDCPRAGVRPTPEELAAAIRALKRTPNAFVTNGPFIEATLNEQPIGSVQTVQGAEVLMRLRISAPLWIDVTEVTVYRNGVPVEQFVVPSATEPLRCDRALELDVQGDCWFVVRVVGKTPMVAVYGVRGKAPTPWAITNPFWVDADGDGEVRVDG